jgi:protein-ribulosamine 3-kinase
MLPPEISLAVTRFLKDNLYPDLQLRSDSVLSGGSINHVIRLDTNHGKFCLKYNSSTIYPGMFQKEAAGLEILRTAGEIRVPGVIFEGDAGPYSYLLLEYVDPVSKIEGFMADFGHCLAGLHRHTAPKFGLEHDNFMGSLAQSNTVHDDFPGFFIKERLGVQLELAMQKGYFSDEDLLKFERLYKALPGIIPEEIPALVHGDLWNGNFIVSEKGRACLIDPAVYYGHREADLAMSMLFGGFSREFYESYNESFPLEKGWRARLEIYNLYPLLVHLNLFGSGYLREILDITRKF